MYIFQRISIVALVLLLANVSYAQESVSVPSDEASQSEETGTLDQELQALHPQDKGQLPQDATEKKKSLTDTLSEGLNSLFHEDNEQEQAATPADDTTATNTPVGHFTHYAMLQGLNKITARTSSLEIAQGEAVTLGTLEITMHQCWKSAPEETQENKALLEVWEKKPGEEKSRIFYGWMFSSSPSISALESPIYDVTVLECTDAKEKTDETQP